MVPAMSQVPTALGLATTSDPVLPESPRDVTYQPMIKGAPMLFPVEACSDARSHPAMKGLVTLGQNRHFNMLN